jgi:hypothetical protein
MSLDAKFTAGILVPYCFIRYPNSKRFPFDTPPQLHRLPTHEYHARLPSPLLPIFLSTLLGKIVRSLSVILYFPLSPGYTFTSDLAIGEVKTFYW